MNLKKNNCKNVFFSLSVIIIHINIPFCCNGSPFRDFYPLYIHIVVQSPVKRKIFKSFMRLIVFFFFSILAASRYITSWEFTSRIVSVFVTVSRKESFWDHRGAGHICGTSLYIAYLRSLDPP